MQSDWMLAYLETDDERGAVSVRIRERGKGFNGHIRGGHRVVRAAAEKGVAVLVLDSDLQLPVRVGKHRAGKAPIHGDAPKRSALPGAYGTLARSCQAEGDVVTGRVVVTLNGRHFVFSHQQAGEFVGELVAARRTVVARA
jgi:hypothetical protein